MARIASTTDILLRYCVVGMIDPFFYSGVYIITTEYEESVTGLSIVQLQDAARRRKKVGSGTSAKVYARVSLKDCAFSSFSIRRVDRLTIHLA